MAPTSSSNAAEPAVPPARADRLAHALDAQRAAFKAFLVARVGHAADAEDILQTGLVKALRHAGELRDDTKLTAWFYQLLRRAIIDHARSRRSALARDSLYAADSALAQNSADNERALCRCFEPLLAELKPNHAALLRLVELEGQSVAAAAITLRLTANNASVTLHRARAALRTKLETVCGPCAIDACLDCGCEPAS